MRTREKLRIAKRFKGGASLYELKTAYPQFTIHQIEGALRWAIKISLRSGT